MRRRTLLVALGFVVIVVVVAGLKLSPMGPGPALPAGATRLHIMTEPGHLFPTFGCQTALLAPARVTTTGDDLVLVTGASGLPDDVVWPSGWAAWRIDGQALLVGRDGAIVAHEGDVLTDLGGGVGTDNLFHICIIGG